MSKTLILCHALPDRPGPAEMAAASFGQKACSLYGFSGFAFRSQMSVGSPKISDCAEFHPRLDAWAAFLRQTGAKLVIELLFRVPFSWAGVVDVKASEWPEYNLVDGWAQRPPIEAVEIARANQAAQIQYLCDALVKVGLDPNDVLMLIGDGEPRRVELVGGVCQEVANADPTKGRCFWDLDIAYWRIAAEFYPRMRQAFPTLSFGSPTMHGSLGYMDTAIQARADGLKRWGLSGVFTAQSINHYPRPPVDSASPAEYGAVVSSALAKLDSFIASSFGEAEVWHVEGQPLPYADPARYTPELYVDFMLHGYLPALASLPWKAYGLYPLVSTRPGAVVSDHSSWGPIATDGTPCAALAAAMATAQ